MNSMTKLAAGLVVVLTIAATAQDQRPTFHTEANYVRVDLYPTLRGAPVSDLNQDDFELVEDKVPQKIAAFEHVVVQTHVPEELRRDPGTLAESRQMAETTRGRVFVLFLDIYHVEGTGAVKIRQPLIDALDHTLGDGDLIAVMTPRMLARDLTFTAKTGSVKTILAQRWGERDRIDDERDPEDASYTICYPPGSFCPPRLAEELIDRRRETRTLDALSDLVEYLRGVREERKAVLAITDGWRLFRSNDSLLVPPGVDCGGASPGLPPVGVDPRTGRLGSLPLAPGAVSDAQCETDRRRLALIDDERRIRDIGNEANRANVSFYPIDPRGLVASEQDMQPLGVPNIDLHTTPLSTRADIAQMAARQQSLRTLALDTDGRAVVATNDIPAALRRVADDLSSYYLLGYYSTGKLDGKFHAISVHVKRPGVEVRARRGYLAQTAAEAAAAAVAVPTPAVAVAAAESTVITSALATLGIYSRETPVQVRAAAGWTPDHMLAIWTVGEFSGADWKSGGQADVLLVGSDRQTHATAHTQLTPGTRSFRVRLVPTDPIPAGDYSIVVRSRGAGAAAEPSSDALPFVVPPAPDAAGVLFLRRGVTTGNRDIPTADARFRRTEQIRVEIPTVESRPSTARLLDRTGRPLPTPVQAAIREDADGSRWQTAQLALAPLAPSDYLIELSGGVSIGSTTDTKRRLVAFRVVP
jgi:VWFA-related protein